MLHAGPRSDSAPMERVESHIQRSFAGVFAVLSCDSTVGAGALAEVCMSGRLWSQRRPLCVWHRTTAPFGRPSLWNSNCVAFQLRAAQQGGS